MKSDKRFINQYIDLIKSKPNYILPCDSEAAEAHAEAYITEKVREFPSAICEIGCGAGGHLMEQAARNSGTFFIGLELRYKRLFRAAEKAGHIGLTNLVFMRRDAREIRRIFQPRSLDGIFVNFPDPWSDKRRWHKHRLLTPAFMQVVGELLKGGGFFYYKSDHRERFLDVKRIIEADENFTITKFSEDLAKSEFSAANIQTEFERLFRSKGYPIYFLQANYRLR